MPLKAIIKHDFSLKEKLYLVKIILHYNIYMYYEKISTNLIISPQSHHIIYNI